MHFEAMILWPCLHLWVTGKERILPNRNLIARAPFQSSAESNLCTTRVLRISISTACVQGRFTDGQGGEPFLFRTHEVEEEPACRAVDSSIGD